MDTTARRGRISNWYIAGTWSTWPLTPPPRVISADAHMIQRLTPSVFVVSESSHTRPAFILEKTANNQQLALISQAYMRDHLLAGTHSCWLDSA